MTQITEPTDFVLLGGESMSTVYGIITNKNIEEACCLAMKHIIVQHRARGSFDGTLNIQGRTVCISVKVSGLMIHYQLVPTQVL